MQQKEKIWTPTFILTMTISFVFYFVFYLLTVIIGPYAMADYHAAASIAGILVGIFVVGGFIGRLFAGNKVMQIGIKRMLYAGTIFYLITTLLYFIVPNLGLLILVRLLQGIGFGVAGTAASTVAGLIVPASRRGEGIGYFVLSLTLASAFGPFIAMDLYNSIGYNILVTLSSVCLIVALFLIFFLKIPAKMAERRPAEKKPFSIWNYFEKKALPISFIGFLVGIGYASVLSFLDSFTAQIHLVTAGSLFYVVYAVFIIVSRPITGRLFDSKGDNFVFYPVFVIFAAGLVLTGITHSAFILLLGAALVGLGYGSVLPFTQAIGIRHSAQDRIGIATSTVYGLFDMGVGVGPFLLGLILPMTGYRNLFIYTAGFMIIVGVIYFIIHGRHANKEVI